MKRLVISTLGPSGTCSEYAAAYYSRKNNLNAEIYLHTTFEKSISALKKKQSDLVIIPSAYYKLKDIIFGNYNSIKLVDVFIFQTPDLVIIVKNDDEEKVKKVVTHQSPSALIENQFPTADIVFANSNSEAAELFLKNDFDACLTTIHCAKKNSYNIKYKFDGIIMGWNVFSCNKR